MNKYKIVFVDIDDTLNVRNKPVSENTKNVMSRIKDKNIFVVINTGRSMKYAIERSKMANLSKYVVSSNGSEVYDYQNDKIIFSSIIPKETVKKIYEYCQSVGVIMLINSFNEKFSNTQLPDNYGDGGVYFENIDEVLEKHPITQIVLVSDNYDRMIVIPNLFKEKYPEIKFSYSSRSLLDNKRIKKEHYTHNITANNVSKGTGIAELLDYLNISSDDAIAIGDDYVDLTMFDMVKTKIAVADGFNELKEQADIICPSAKEEGVAQILEKLLLENE